MAEGIRNRKFECTQSEMGGKRREEVGGQRREAGDVAQGAPQRALCDVWRREVGIRIQESGGRRYESGEGTWDMGIWRSDVGEGMRDFGGMHRVAAVGILEFFGGAPKRRFLAKA